MAKVNKIDVSKLKSEKQCDWPGCTNAPIYRFKGISCEEHREQVHYHRHGFIKMQKRVAEKGYECDIDKGYYAWLFETTKVCPYTGTELSRGTESRKLGTSPSLDRIDNSKGYTKDNVEVVSMFYNTLKSSRTQEEMVRLAKNIIANYGPY